MILPFVPSPGPNSIISISFNFINLGNLSLMVFSISVSVLVG